MRANEVIRIICKAFAGVRLGGGIGLREGHALDAYADPATCAAVRTRDEKDDWTRLHSGELNSCHSSLSFFDAEGMRFHLPAFLVATLRGEYHFDVLFTLEHDSDYARSRFVLLSAEQRHSVRAFLSFCLASPDFDDARTEIAAALRGFWA